MKQLVILAGGKGTRLKDRLGDLPKPLIDVCGMPLLERQILLAKRYGFTNVIILVNHLAAKILEFCESKECWGLSIECIDDGEPRGTAGAVIGVIDRLESEFLVMYGDTMLEVDLDRFHQYHLNSGPDVAATLFLHPNDHPQDSDLVEVDERGRVVGFYPYPHDQSSYYPNLVNAALYWVRRTSLDQWRNTSHPIDFGKELFPLMIQSGLKLSGYNSPEYIKDCGTPERIDKVCADFESGRIQRAGLMHQQRAIFIDRDGTMIREEHHLNAPEKLELLPGIGSAIRRLNMSEYRVCVVTNQPVVARGECSLPTLRRIHNKLETLLGSSGAYVDRIYYCPHHPDSGYDGEIAELKVNCGCRKPNVGMIDAAVSELNVSVEQSWLIGDTTTDILTAKNAGLRSILVETGYAGLDQKYWAIPDYVFPDLASAVNFVIDVHPRLMESLTTCAASIQPGDLVLVGGQSRSGKSHFSNALRDRLKLMGKSSHVVSTDRWLRSENKRSSGVMGRYDMDGIKAFAECVTSNKAELSISLPGYNKSTKEQTQNVEMFLTNAKDIIILEGVLALTLKEMASSAIQVYVKTNEATRRERVIREYRLRGMSERAAIQVYESRLDDEFKVVEETAKFATWVHTDNYLTKKIDA